MFEKLAQESELTVLFCSEKPRHREWETWPREYDYRYKVLPGVSPFEFNFNPSVIWEIWALKPDVVIISDYSKPTMMIAFYACRLLGIPIVYWTEGVEEPRGFLAELTKPVRRSFNKHSDAILAQGEITRRYLIGQNVPSSKIIIAHNCIEERTFIEASDRYRGNKHVLREEYNVPLDHTVFLFVGALVERKGIRDLVDIWKKVQETEKNVHLIVYGSGPLKDYIRREMDEKRLRNVSLLDSGRSQEELVKIYSMSDIFLFPTLIDLAPLVLNEAMACMLPLIVTDGAGNSHDLVDDGVNGYKLPKGDVAAFVETIDRVLKDEAKQASMEWASRDILLERGSSNRTAQSFIQAVTAAHHRRFNDKIE